MILGYRATCPRCRLLSALTVVASAGRITRVPLGDLALALPADRLPPDVQARPAFWDGDVLHVGADVWPAVRRALVRRWVPPWG